MTLYELAARRPAYGDSTRQKLVRRILGEDPPRIRSIEPGIPRDFETILARATTREPRDRYQTAEEFAADLERFTQHQTIQARPSGRMELLRRWAIRNPIVTCLLVAVLLLLSGISAVSLSSASRLAKAAHNIQQRLYVSDMVRVQELIQNGENRKAIEILERHIPAPNEDDMRGVEWHLLRTSAESIHPTATLGHQVMAFNARYSPNGKYLATSTWTGEVCIWNTETWVRDQVLNGDATYERRCLSLVFTPNGEQVIGACLDGVVRIWQVDSIDPSQKADAPWKELKSLAHNPDLPPCASRVAVSPDGDYLAVAYTGFPYNQVLAMEGEIRIGIWRLSDAKLVKILDNVSGARADLAFSNKVIAATSTDGKLRIWNRADWSLVRTIPVAAVDSYALAFSRDGTRLAIGGGIQHAAFFRGSIAIWDTDRWQPIRTIEHHDDAIRSLEFSPDGKTLAAGSDDHGASLWFVDSGQCLQSWKAHSGIVKDISFSPNGNQIATASYDNLAKVWNLEQLLQPASPHTAWGDHRAFVHSVCFADEGRSLFSADAAGQVVKRDFESGAIIDELSEVPDPVAWRIQVACSPNNQRVAVATGVEDAGQISIYNQITSKLLRSIELDESFTHGLAFSPNSKIIAAASYESLFICDVESGQQLAQIPELSHTKMVAFSPDGKELAAAATTGETYFFETKAFKQIRKLQTETTWGTMAIAYAPQGDVFATVGGDLRIKLWDTRHHSDQPIFVFPEAASNWIGSVAFSPDGKRILSTGINGTVQVWHRDLGESVLNLQSSRNWIMTGAFAPDGRGIVIGADGVHAWKAAPTFRPPVIRQPPNRPCFQAFELNAK